MSDLKQRMDGIDHLPVPDLWKRAQDEAASHRGPKTSMLRRSAIIAAALLISVASIAFVVVAFRPQPAVPPTAPATVVNGHIWVQVGGNDAGTAIYRIEPDMKQPPVAMWTDSPDTFTGATKAPQLLSDDYAFSPDGSQVAFSAQIHEGSSKTPRELFVMNADGSGVRQLTHDGAYDGFPAWSPDGSQIIYARYEGHDYIPGCLGFVICPTGLYIVDTTGGQPVALAANLDGSETTPSWSPDGSRIAFAQLNENGSSTIDTIGADGSDLVELTPGGGVSFPTWSPDGRVIMFLMAIDGTNHIWTVTPDNTVAQDIVNTHTDTNFGRPVWSPDGNLIAYAAPFAGSMSLWTIDASGDRSPERIAGFPGFEAAPLAWQPMPVSTASPGPTQNSNTPTGVNVAITKGATLDVTGGQGLVAAAQEAFGSLWVVVQTDADLVLQRVDPSTGAQEASIPLSGWSNGEWGGNGIVIGDGYVWTYETVHGHGTLLKIDPQTNKAEMLPLDADVISYMSMGSDGMFWAHVGRAGHNEVAQIDPATGTIVQRWPYTANWSMEVCESSGTAWVHEMAVSNSTVHGGWLSQIVPDSGLTVTTGGTFAGPVCSSDAVWSASYGDSTSINLANGIAKIDPTTGLVVGSWKTPAIGYDIALDDRDGVWFLTAATGEIERLDTSTGEITNAGTATGTPIFITTAGDHVWVGTYEGHLVRIDVTRT